MRTRTARSTAPPTIVLGSLLLFLGAALATAAPAAAIDDPTRPDARVTHGPSCRAGGLVVEVAAGTAPYSVRLASTRSPAGEDEATLEPGQRVVLRGDDVAWGETIDGRLEFTARDGSGVIYTDELEEYSFTRPTQEDCAAIVAPAESAPESGQPSPSSPAQAPSTTPSSSPGGQSPVPTAQPSTTPTATATPGPPRSTAPSPTQRTGSTAPRQVTAGGTVTLEAAGFLPGERVTIQLHDTGEVLGAATANRDGAVLVEVRIPGRTSPGPATVDLVGDDSAVIADVDLRVAGAETALTGEASDVVPLTAAAVSLVGSAGALVSIAGRHRSDTRGRVGVPSA